MCKGDRAATGRPATETSALEALSRLAAKGAFAEPADPVHGTGGAFAVFSPRIGPQALGTIPAPIIVWACSRGWLASDQGSNRYRIAAAGVEALRRAKCGQSPPTRRSRTRPALARQEAAAGIAPTLVTREGSLPWLRRRKDKDGRPLITEPQFAAGERLAADFWHAQLMPRVTANWSAVAPDRRTRRAAPGVGVDLSDSVVAARQRVSKALAAVGPELAGILIDVCCLDVALAAAERTHRLPTRAGKTFLQLALTFLARHYGLLPTEPPPNAYRLRHWGGEGYRPTLGAWR
jgi:hypothetical protein